MSVSLRIAVADDERDMQDYFRKMLPRLGHEVVAVAGTGQELIDHCQEHSPDLVLTDIKMPELDGVTALERVYSTQPVPAILVSAQHNFSEAVPAHSYSVQLPKPFKQADLEPAIALAQLRFAQFRRVWDEAADVQQACAEFPIVDRAKQKLMTRERIGEQAAFDQLAAIAGGSHRRIVDVAREMAG